MTGLSNRSGHDESPGKSPAKIEIYTTRHCGYCVRAKQLLQAKGLAFIEHAVDGDDEVRRRMMERADGRRSLPQIFINGLGIGGYMDLYQLDRGGRLEALLAGDDADPDPG